MSIVLMLVKLMGRSSLYFVFSLPEEITWIGYWDIFILFIQLFSYKKLSFMYREEAVKKQMCVLKKMNVVY